MKISNEIISKILGEDFGKKLSEKTLKEKIQAYQNNNCKPKARSLFKKFSQDPSIVYLVKKYNPYKGYFDKNQKEKINFQEAIKTALINAFMLRLNLTSKEAEQELEKKLAKK